jgi:hypothetical protein
MNKRIRVIASHSVEDQDSIEEFIGQERDVIETWKCKDSTLNKGQVGVKLDLNKETNPKQQWSILNKDEYIFI